MSRHTEELFARKVAGRGRLLADSELGGIQTFMSTVFDQSMKDLADDSTSGNLFRQLCEKTHYKLIDNQDPNACAIPLGVDSFLGFHSGTATVVAAIAFAALQSEQVWAGLPGGISHKSAFAPLIATLSKRRQLIADPAVDTDGDALYREPNHERRASLASMISASAWQFMLFHEFMHVARGHLDFVTSELGMLMMLEADEEDSRSGNDRPVLHAIELDADRWATAMLADQINPPSLNDNESRSSVEDQLRRQIIAFGILFEVFDWRGLPLYDATQRRHPHPAVRMTSAVDSFIGFVIERGVDADFEDAVSRAYQDLAEIGKPLNWTLMQVMGSSQDEIGSQISDGHLAFDDRSKKLGMRAMLQRKEIDLNRLQVR